MSIVTDTYGDSIIVVRYNNPRKKNALDIDMYNKISSILKDVAKNDTICGVVLTGTGDFYSSGNDINNVINRRVDCDLYTALKNFIQALIEFPKVLIAVVNGPAIGIAATTLPLCDLVFASENSYFYTPFTKLGIVPEGTSTFTFTRLLGERKALEMLMFNQKLSAKEALDVGFINDIYKPEEIQEKVWNRIEEVTKIPNKALISSKRLIRRQYMKNLLDTNIMELDAVDELRPISKL